MELDEQPFQYYMVYRCYEAEYLRKKGNTFDVDAFLIKKEHQTLAAVAKWS
jgi:hypothetical protein